MKPKILFLSAIDFKEKSIQVILNTPIAYAQKGWSVDYLVARDNSRTGNYFYEREINPKDIRIFRTYWPNISEKLKSIKPIFYLAKKFASFVAILRLARIGAKLLRENHYDVLYGYEVHGTLALRLIRHINKKAIVVTRFQGSFLYEMITSRNILRLILNTEHIIALRTKSNLTIMTNDGTQGDKAFEKLKNNKYSYNFRFWTNGVDNPTHLTSNDFNLIVNNRSNSLKIVTISRLVNWKRVDRCIKLVNSIVTAGKKNVKLFIIGDGEQRDKLEELTTKLNLSRNVEFLGALPHKIAMMHLRNADIFVSMYESSNVGNPLLEAIRCKKIIITLDNGDTSTWIKHWESGLIYKEETFINYDLIRTDIEKLIGDTALQIKLRSNLREICETKLWTWSERLEMEVDQVDCIRLNNSIN